MFQDAASALNPVLTVGAQLAEAVRIGTDLTTRVVRERCIELLRDVGISDPERRLDMYPHQFSGGMKQRIVIAIALAQDPQVLLADEPTSALDVTIQQQILTLLRELQKKLGMAILIVTHDLNLVGRFADDVAVMYAGRIAESGDVTTVLCEPLHPYTQALRASVPGGAEGRGRPLPTIAGEPPMVGSLPAGCAFRARCERTRAPRGMRIGRAVGTHRCGAEGRVRVRGGSAGMNAPFTAPVQDAASSDDIIIVSEVSLHFPAGRRRFMGRPSP